jgi:hypothetical protein
VICAKVHPVLPENPMSSFAPLRFVLISVAGWMNQHQLQMIEYLREENRVLAGRFAFAARSDKMDP